MIYTQKEAAVIEFPMEPHVNRCFGHMAAALGLDYFVVPEVTAFYHQQYTMDEIKAKHVIATLRHVIEHKGLHHLLPQREEL